MQKKSVANEVFMHAPPGRSGLVAEQALLPHVRPAIVILLAFTVLAGLVYPLAMTGIAQVAFPTAANGSLLVKDGKVIGSSLIGQNFAGERYFHGRPSATSGPDPKDASKSIAVPYNAANSGGSNLGPLSKALQDRVTADVAALRSASGATVVPADAVTASASGLDPDISPDYALLQVTRIAKARHLAENRLRQVVANAIEAPALGFIGEPRVNVLKLNLALDATPAT